MTTKKTVKRKAPQKKRKLRLRIPPLKELFSKGNVSSDRKPRRRRRKIRKEVLFGGVGILAVIILLVCLITIPKSKQTKALKELGYTKETIALIREQKLTKTILNNGYYSDYLAQSINDGTLKVEYIDLYNVTSIADPLSNTDFLVYHRLLDKGYTQDQVVRLFSKLKFYELTPLLVFDTQSDVNPYIDDCMNHRDVNNENHFELDGNYFTPYENTIAVYDTNDIEKLVNKTYYLPKDFIPNEPTTLSVVYAAKDVQLSQDAYEAFVAFCDAGINMNIRFYAASAYRDYEYQETLYNNYINAWGEEKADALSARPGHSEHQTGLTVDLASANTDGISEYKDTVEYAWTSTNCQDYGFILRYPEGKSSITGYDFESWHYRYVGIETAQKVVESNLTYDEYYCLYLKPWESESSVVSYAGCTQSFIPAPTE